MADHDWLASRPECVQRLAAEFPMPATCEIDGMTLWLIGYTESDKLIFVPSEGDPHGKTPEEFARLTARERRIVLCAAHFRDGRKLDS